MIFFFFRYQRKYRLFAGLWFGKKKPDFKTFFNPFAQELKEFGDNGTAIKPLHFHVNN